MHSAQELRLQDKLALLVFLRRLVRLVVLPANRMLALAALDVTHHVSACRHVALHRFFLDDVDHSGEEICFAVLAAEVLDALAQLGNAGLARQPSGKARHRSGPGRASEAGRDKESDLQ